MSIERLCELAFEPIQDGDAWRTRCEAAFEGLFAGSDDRYHQSGWGKKVRPRINADTSGSGVPYAALLHPDNPDSGPYGGMSFVLFPPVLPDGDASDDEDAPKTALFGLVVGTRGLHPDEETLARPGHARKTRAICRWLNDGWSGGRQVAWAKSDPVRTDREMPRRGRRAFDGHDRTLERYGDVIYGAFQPPEHSDSARETTEDALKAFLDLMCEERGISTMASASEEATGIRNAYLGQVFETREAGGVFEQLARRKYAVLEGPPGTGKTRLASRLLNDSDYYDGHGQTVQFHPNTTYEDFVGGLAPESGGGDVGLQFEPTPGTLIRAADRAREVAPAPYLLHIDEINRADLAKVLGEAVYLFEYRQFQSGDATRHVELAHDFSDHVDAGILEDGFHLPENLHVLGTMNTSDRSIAHLDVAIRRRFAFLKMWPQQEAVRHFIDERVRGSAQDDLRALILGDNDGQAPSANLFGELVDIFVNFAPEDALDLMPGHSYFLAESVEELKERMQGELVPLLEQYVREGHVAGFADELRAYMQMVDAVAGG